MKLGSVLNQYESKNTKTLSEVGWKLVIFDKQADKKSGTIQALNCLIGTIQ